MKDAPHGIAYEVAHTTIGRIRLRIPQLKSNAAYASQLQQLVAAQTGVADLRINAAAHSIIITYKPKIISEEAMRRQLHDAIQQAGGIDPATVPFPADAAIPASEPAPSPPVPSSPELSNSQPEAASQSIETQPQAPGAVTPEAVEASSESPIELPAESQKVAEPPEEPFKGTNKEPEADDQTSDQSTPADLKHEINLGATIAEQSQADGTLRLNQKLLAKRLKISSTSLRQHRSQSDFSTWSSTRDPEGKAWKYESQSGHFYAVGADEHPPDAGVPDGT